MEITNGRKSIRMYIREDLFSPYFHLYLVKIMYLTYLR